MDVGRRWPWTRLGERPRWPRLHQFTCLLWTHQGNRLCRMWLSCHACISSLQDWEGRDVCSRSGICGTVLVPERLT